MICIYKIFIPTYCYKSKTQLKFFSSTLSCYKIITLHDTFVLYQWYGKQILFFFFFLDKCISYIFHLFKVGTTTNSELCLKTSRVMLGESCAYSCLDLNVCAFYIVLYLLLNLGTVIPLYKSYTMYTKRLKIHRVPI